MRTAMKDLENLIEDQGLKLFANIRSRKDGLLDKDYWQGKLIDWATKDLSFKIDLFRLVDVLPSLYDNNLLNKHIKEYLLKDERDLPLFLTTALKASGFSFAKNISSAIFKKNVLAMAERFILGESLKEAEAKILKIYSEGFSSTIDLLGEACLSEKEAENYFFLYKDLIEKLPKIINGMPNISIKLTSLSSKLKPESLDYSVDLLQEKIFYLIDLAKKNNCFINFDTENFTYKNITYDLFIKTILHDSYKDWPHLGIVLQSYLKDSAKDFLRLLEAAKKRKTPFTVRLVKGAYYDYEVVRSDRFGYPCPVFAQKSQTDLCYEDLSRKLIDNAQHLKPAFASHNLRSLAHALVYAEEKNLKKQEIEIQMLYGMAEKERYALKEEGVSVRLYAPIGNLMVGMSYLVRRLLENTSQLSFVRLAQSPLENPAKLLQKPLLAQETKEELDNSFNNAPNIEFSYRENQEKIAAVIKQIKQNFPIIVNPVINGEEKKGGNYYINYCPSYQELIISKINFAKQNDADLAMESAYNSFSLMQNLSINKRCENLYNLANILEKEKLYFISLLVWELGKNFLEAESEVLEAIDFCNFYADMAKKHLFPKKILSKKGEENTLYLHPKGPAAIIAPWNFPLAILCGMSVGAYVAGNPVILKPAKQANGVGFSLFKAMLNAGFLKEAVHFLPGFGEDIGKYLVNHPKIKIICFTGSKDVGLAIMQKAYDKKVMAEMGGKNAIIVDEDADQDEAIRGILQSTYGFQGQKCSASSRLILINNPHQEKFLARLMEAAKSIKIGASDRLENFMGPVIDKEAFLRLKEQISLLEQDNGVEILYKSKELSGGLFIPIIMAKINDQNHYLFQKELFGPILCIYIAQDLDDAIKAANNSQYALTFGFYSRSPQNIQKVTHNIEAGNIYINQKITGAIVARQPFGGFKMSGTSVKAGGEDYLYHFVHQVAVSENTSRQGVTPEVSV